MSEQPSPLRRSPRRHGQPAAPAAAASRGGRRQGRANCDKEERMFSLANLESVLPIGGDQWERIEELHRERFADRQRDKLSLRKQFHKLANKKIPTGDPNCPEDVRMAKHVMRMIQIAADAQEDILLDDGALGIAAEDQANQNANTPGDVQENASVPGSVARPLAAPRGTGHGRRSTSSLDVAIQLMATSQANREEDRRLQQQQMQLQLQQNQQFNSMLMQFGMVVAERLLPGVGERVQQLVPPSVAAPPVAAPPVASPQAARWLNSDSSVSESSGVE